MFIESYPQWAERCGEIVFKKKRWAIYEIPNNVEDTKIRYVILNNNKRNRKIFSWALFTYAPGRLELSGHNNPTRKIPREIAKKVEQIKQMELIASM